MTKEWQSVDHALAYLARADTIPHRTEGEAALIEEVSPDCKRILDLGTGDGRLMSLLLLRCPSAKGIAIDFSPAMIARARERFHDDDRVRVLEHDFSEPLPDLGTHDAVCSSFAIHHVSHDRKRSLYQEIWEILEPGGVFCNLEHVSSPTSRLHVAIHRRDRGPRGHIKHPARRRDTTELVARDRFRGRGLPMEMAGIGST